MKKQNHKHKAVFAVAGIVAFAALFAFGAVFFRPDSGAARWYSAAQASAGEKVFVENCLSCHGAQARGAANWNRRGTDGFFPPPPLNGTAHTWHHPFAALKGTIKNGGAPVGGNMPAFKDRLTDAQVESVLAYVQSFWADEIYQVWEEKVNTH